MQQLWKHIVWILPLAFLGSCVGLLEPARRLADPMTHKPVDDRSSGPFPVLVVSADTAKVNMVENPGDIPPPPSGTSYLVPPEKASYFERYIREHDAPLTDSNWVLRVFPLSSDHQRIELFLMGDGYRGGVYDATSKSVTPLFRKTTGPGFALIVGPLAFLLNCVVWGLVGGVVWSVKRWNKSKSM
jgi:hypothetical protein